jgi:hypothetical protein
METQSDAIEWTWRVIDFTSEPKEYELWVNVPPIERLRAARRIIKMAYAIQRRSRRSFQPTVTVIER